MPDLKLMALDTDDLDVLSAHMQDAVVKAGEFAFDRKLHQFLLTGRRFVWETVKGARSKSFERRLTALHFNRVLSVRSKGIDRQNKDAVLVLLTMQFFPDGDDGSPGGEIELIFADDISIQLTVECVEVQLADLGPAWETASRPRH